MINVGWTESHFHLAETNESRSFRLSTHMNSRSIIACAKSKQNVLQRRPSDSSPTRGLEGGRTDVELDDTCSSRCSVKV